MKISRRHARLFITLFLTAIISFAPVSVFAESIQGIWWGMEDQGGTVEDVMYFFLDDGYQVVMKRAEDGRYMTIDAREYHENTGEVWRVFSSGETRTAMKASYRLQAEGEQLLLDSMEKGSYIILDRLSGTDQRLAGTWLFTYGGNQYSWEITSDNGMLNIFPIRDLHFDARNGFYALWSIDSQTHRGLAEFFDIYHYEDDGKLVLELMGKGSLILERDKSSDGGNSQTYLSAQDGGYDPDLFGIWTSDGGFHGLIVYEEGYGYEGWLSEGVSEMEELQWSTKDGVLTREWWNKGQNDTYLVENDTLTITGADGKVSTYSRMK